MRIISGAKKGMRLVEPPSRSSRPILDRVKESLFNILATYGLPGDASVADLFAGVGSLGIEALSRGARLVTFVESDPDVVRVLRDNIARSGMADRARVVVADVFETGLPLGPDQGYGLVFVDPPYAATSQVGPGSRLHRLLGLVCGQADPAALVVVRTHCQTILADRYAHLSVIDRREYGKTALTFLARYRPTVVRV